MFLFNNTPNHIGFIKKDYNQAQVITVTDVKLCLRLRITLRYNYSIEDKGANVYVFNKQNCQGFS